MHTVNDLLKKRKYNDALSFCNSNNLSALSDILSLIVKTKENLNIIKVRLECNWLESKDIVKLWSKMSKNGKGRWDNIQIISSDEGNIDDYTVIINAPRKPDFKFNHSKTIIFRMEPNMHLNPTWGEWCLPNDREKFLKVFRHEDGYNNNEWHLSKTYSELKTEKITKSETNNISTVLSSKYYDIGHIKRIDFVKFLELDDEITIDVYGSNTFNYKNYMGPLPMNEKDDAIFKYKYTFNAENHEIYNYYTEKIIDGILGECLTFYWGCPNIPEYIDSRAYVILDLDNFELSKTIVKKAIKEDWWSKRIEYIREAKNKILDELQFFPRLNKIINK